MKKLIAFTILLALSGALHAQTASTGDELRQTDNAVRSLATELAQKLTTERAETVTIGQFSYQGGSSQFNAYLNNQLSGALLDARGRTFTLVSGVAAQWVVSGEIVRIGESVRVYVRLIRRADNALVAQIPLDMELNRSIAAMFSAVSSEGGSSSMVIADEWEPDSRENPMAYSLGTDLYDMPVRRTIHADDHDWFAIEPDSPMSLVVETSGNMDTYMTLYDADTSDELASNDDGGEGTNAMIRHFVRPGKRYLIEVRGYSSGSTGEYSFSGRSEDMGNATPYQLGRSTDARTVTQNIEDASNMFILTPATNGMMIIETTGELDLMMELFDGETYESIAEDDDSGLDYNARLVEEVVGGKPYLVRIRAISSDSEGEYGFRGYLYGE